MSTTPDRAPGPSSEERIDFDVQSGESTTLEGQLLYSDGQFKMRDSTGEYDPRTGSGLSETQHESLDTLTHRLTETHNIIVTRSGGKVSQVLSEEVGGTDIRKVEILSRSNGKVATFRETQYESDGTTVKRQLDATVNRTAGKVSSMNVVRTV